MSGGTPRLEDYPIRVEQPVAWGQMDALGHLNNTVYFRFFEDARMAAFEAIGLNAHMEATGEGPILAKTSCVFRAPITWPDRITVGTRIVDLGEDRFTMEYAIFSEAKGLAAIGDGRIVLLDYATGEKVAVPPAIREAIEAL
ncbi:MAG: thioesterase family protein [Deltaproteobacteria bacterium]|nr:thioesterase family protein [Deltaproteobacteria bacterium]